MIGPKKKVAPPRKVKSRYAPERPAPTTSAVAISKLSAYMPPATPAKKPAMMNDEVAHALHAVADELDPLGVVAHRVQHPAERRSREGDTSPRCRGTCRSRAGSRPGSAARR